jgi:hypothetical protein
MPHPDNKPIEQSHPLCMHAEYPTTEVNRALWLIKWILAIPHWVILAGLTLFTLTVLYPFAILRLLLTNNLPSGYVWFCVGLMRWWWRVIFYAFSPLGTDGYPPFSLSSNAEYPAEIRLTEATDTDRTCLAKQPVLFLAHAFMLPVLFGSRDLLMLSYRLIRAGRDFVTAGQATSNETAINIGPSLTEAGWNSLASGVLSVPGIFGLLFAVSIVHILFRGAPHRTVFELLVGLWTWVFRVVGYGLLLYRHYPRIGITR